MKTKPFFISALFLLQFCLSAIVDAAPTYGTKMPKSKEIFGGVQSYTVIDRDMEKDYGTMKSQQEFLLLSYGVCDWFSLDLKGGFGNIYQRSSTGPDFDYDTYLGGGYGFRIKLYDHEGTKAVIGFQHISIHPRPESLGPDKHKTVLDDWQFPLVISHDIYDWTPYVGVRWSWMNQIHWINTERFLEKAEDNVGVIVGTDIPLSKKMWLNVEGQFIDATAVSGSINFAF